MHKKFGHRGITDFATDQTKFELEKGKHFLKVLFYNLLTGSFGLLVPHIEKNQQYNTQVPKTYCLLPHQVHCYHIKYNILENRLENMGTNLLSTKLRIILISDIQKNLNLHVLPCI